MMNENDIKLLFDVGVSKRQRFISERRDLIFYQ